MTNEINEKGMASNIRVDLLHTMFIREGTWQRNEVNGFMLRCVFINLYNRAYFDKPLH